jgi:hypothetical protein
MALPTTPFAAVLMPFLVVGDDLAEGAHRPQGGGLPSVRWRMNKVTILETPVIMLWYYPDAGIVHHQVRKHPDAAEFESALEKGVEVLQLHGAHKWLSDDRRSGPLPKSHQEWAQKVWIPKAVAAGWKYWAFLLPTELVGSVNVGRLVEDYAALGVTVQIFTDPEDAMRWLVAQPG